MKELSIEEKAKRYDEALERAKFLKENTDGVGATDVSRCFEEIFPELKESEDEIIRKALIKYHSFDKDGGSHALDNITPKQILTWLEKQGEQKPAIDKIESKFKVGDWITNDEYTWKVIDIKPLDYILQSPNGDVVDDNISYVDEYFHLLTIRKGR